VEVQAGRKHRRFARFPASPWLPPRRVTAPHQSGRGDRTVGGSVSTVQMPPRVLLLARKQLLPVTGGTQGQRAHMSQEGPRATTRAFPTAGPPDDRWLSCRLRTRVRVLFAATRVRPHAMVSVGSSRGDTWGTQDHLRAPLVCGT
jgi:hypothetical protein